MSVADILLPYQKVGVEFALEHRYTLNLSGMGLGKTIMALGVAERVGGNILVIAPRFLFGNWVSEVRKFTTLAPDFLTFGEFSRKKPIELKKKYNLVIVDEIHYLKSVAARRTWQFANWFSENLPEYFVGLTGTPVKGRVPEFYVPLVLAGLNPAKTSGLNVKELFPDYDDFANHFCFPCGRDPYRRSWEGFRANRATDLVNLCKHKVFLPEETGLQLPELRQKYHRVELGKKVDYEELQKDFDIYLRTQNLSVPRTIKTQSALAKAPFTAEYAKSLYSEVESPIVIFSDQIAPVDYLAEVLKCPKITGSVPMDVRQGIYERFQKGEYKYLVATIGSFSVGVNLTNSANLIFNDLSWVPGDNAQAMKRIHRIGQDKPCTIHTVVGSAIDKAISATLLGKQEVITSVAEACLASGKV